MATILKEAVHTIMLSGERFIAAHIPGQKNGIADKLSRGFIDEAKVESFQLFKKAVVVQLPVEANPILEGVKIAATKALRQKRKEVAEEKEEKNRSEVARARHGGGGHPFNTVRQEHFITYFGKSGKTGF